MKVRGPRMKARAIRYEASRKGKPYRAKIVIEGKTRDLGRYASREEAEAACRAVRKVLPAKQPTKPPLTDAACAAILSTYEQLRNGRATARTHSVSHETVQRIVKSASAALGRDPREPIGDCW
jgi:hypothetical protein